jgi:hypothetical protein
MTRSTLLGVGGVAAGRAMSQENVEKARAALDALNMGR